MGRARVVITGIGAVSPLGLTATAMWEGLCEGRCGIKQITAFDPVGFTCKIAGEVPEFKVQSYVPKSFRKSVKLMCRDIELSIVAADDAIKSSGLITKGMEQETVTIDPTRTGINFGAGLISCDMVELAPAISKSATDGIFDIKKWGKEGLAMVTPLWLLKYLPNMLACHVGIIHDIQGPSNTITCAEASGHLAIAEAVQIISRGDADIMVAGGAEAKVNPIIMIRQCLLKRATSENNDNPEGACRPFDADAKGSVFGEGGGVLVLENMERAVARGAKIYAEVVGIGQSNSINKQYEYLEADGKGVQIAIEKALSEAKITGADLDLIIPHGTGVACDDVAEAKGIEAAVGDAVKKIPVWPTKSMLSNTGAASGAIDVVAAVLAMNNNKIPAAKNCDKKAEGCNLNIVKETRDAEINYALSCSYTYGGQTAAVVLKKFDGK